MQSGRRQVIHRAEQPFEAPNWTPDGSALIYNGSGRGENRGKLFRFDLATRQPTRHRHRLLQPQQQRSRALVRRHHARHQRPERGTAVRHLHACRPAGGAPKRITPLTPSYLHGWSPDGKWLVYTGGRNGEFDIYTIAVGRQSGTEKNLTNVEGPGRRPGVLAGRQVHLLQLGAQRRHHADLADEGGRHASRSR